MTAVGRADAPAEADGTTPLPPGVRLHPHQVAGHRAEEGRTSALATEDGFFLKPLPADARGACELSLYERVAAAAAAESSASSREETAALVALARFVPSFAGVALPRGASGGTHLRLRDATLALAHPCVADVKLGFDTGSPRFGAAYAAKCAAKDAATTSATLGFRLAGMQHWRRAKPHDNNAPSASAWACERAARDWCKALDDTGATSALTRFVTCGCAPGARGAAIAAALLRGPCGMLAQLAALTAWFETQRELLFFGASVLLLFDAEPLVGLLDAVDDGAAHALTQLDAAALRVDVKLVDFAHVLPAEGARDDNALGGLRNLSAALEAASR